MIIALLFLLMHARSNQYSLTTGQIVAQPYQTLIEKGIGPIHFKEGCMVLTSEQLAHAIIIYSLIAKMVNQLDDGYLTLSVREMAQLQEYNAFFEAVTGTIHRIGSTLLIYQPQVELLQNMKSIEEYYLSQVNKVIMIE